MAIESSTRATALPLISIVTPSFNQGQFIEETLQSLVEQDYPNLEVIIQDGGSTDDSIAVAERYVQRYPTIFQLYVEKDTGQANAINRGFAKARGEILAFLNSDDTLYRGCLHSVAREIDPAKGRYVVFGRSLFTGEDSPYVGVEHPAEFRGHFDHLAIWKRGFNTIPQPSTFWHRSVWAKCGGVNESEHHVLDYDLFCRFSRHFRFHRVDELWSTYRMHAVSKSAQRTEAEVLAMTVAASRRNWPAVWHPLHWRLALSQWWHARDTHERARHHARQAEQAFASGRSLAGVSEFAVTLGLSPRMAWHRLLQPRLVGLGLDGLEHLIWKRDAEGAEFTGRHPDGWIGPIYRENLPWPAGAKRLRVAMQHNPQPNERHGKIIVELHLDGRLRATKTVKEGGQFEIATELADIKTATSTLELRVRPYFIPSDYEGSDNRKLTALLLGLHFE